MKKRKLIIIIIFVFIIFLPFLRSCDEISSGFPTVILEGDSVYNYKSFHILNFLINLIIMTVPFLLIIKYYNKIISKQYIKTGIDFLIVYHVLIFIFFYGVYFLFYADTSFVIDYIIIPFLYLLYPLILIFKFEFLEEISKSSFLFGDDYDINNRIQYIFSLIIYFSFGIIFHFIFNYFKKLKLKLNNKN